ncbi:hypothetical protein [Chlorobium sp. N1]|uniref:hypothetical protein n=1 Tax=Chlorobium sp. N1 TaxID=2491138 RepID=UPI00103EB53C|nr:hypothetical protein [Chlorobium sp. N1]TCD47202.1 hypothetical protein E0L29_08890 [Chlorobium sp. N1]
MIHVDEQPEPQSFDAEVRSKGVAWLRKNRIALDRALPKGATLKPFWRSCLDDLHVSYNHYCAYLAISIERVTGGGSVDHFIAKSKRVDLAYEWSNYRLACSLMNSRKRDYEDVLDPFEVENGWFRLELVSGRIYPDPGLPVERKETVRATIDRLGLDDAQCRATRASHFQEYLELLYPEAYLRKRSPFVWHEASRQGLL